ncbi:hypothetical protein ACFPM7_28050 [Actinokineospora guangxiensis]|uniref:YggT family protein n=1 Tax=Actinokineospora guangxiensis TaxID=1490288 RepID=A0ABW0EXE5_9PSEU
MSDFFSKSLPTFFLMLFSISEVVVVLSIWVRRFFALIGRGILALMERSVQKTLPWQVNSDWYDEWHENWRGLVWFAKLVVAIAAGYFFGVPLVAWSIWTWQHLATP